MSPKVEQFAGAQAHGLAIAHFSSVLEEMKSEEGCCGMEGRSEWPDSPRSTVRSVLQDGTLLAASESRRLWHLGRQVLEVRLSSVKKAPSGRLRGTGQGGWQ